MLDPDVTVGGIEGEAEHRRADQDEQHKGRQLGSVFQGLLEQGHAQTAFAHGQNQGTQSAHGAAFGRCSHTQKDGAQNQKDQDQRRHQHKGHLLGQFGEQAQLGAAVDDGQGQSGQRGQGQRHDDDLVAG